MHSLPDSDSSVPKSLVMETASSEPSPRVYLATRMPAMKSGATSCKLSETIGLCLKMPLATRTWESYCCEMAQDGYYGGEPEVQAMCFFYGVYVKIFHGGLEFPIQPRVYGNTEGTGVVLSFVCDGDYDSGHYDLLLSDPHEAQRVDQCYKEWRQHKIRLLRESSSSTDLNTYGEWLP